MGATLIGDRLVTLDLMTEQVTGHGISAQTYEARRTSYDLADGAGQATRALGERLAHPDGLVRLPQVTTCYRTQLPA